VLVKAQMPRGLARADVADARRSSSTGSAKATRCGGGTETAGRWSTETTRRRGSAETTRSRGRTKTASRGGGRTEATSKCHFMQKYDCRDPIRVRYGKEFITYSIATGLKGE
jgi:hypothetical protein